MFLSFLSVVLINKNLFFFCRAEACKMGAMKGLMGLVFGVSWGQASHASYKLQRFFRSFYFTHFSVAFCFSLDYHTQSADYILFTLHGRGWEKCEGVLVGEIWGKGVESGCNCRYVGNCQSTKKRRRRHVILLQNDF